MTPSLLLFLDSHAVNSSPGLALFATLFLVLCTVASFSFLATRPKQGKGRTLHTLAPSLLFGFGVLGGYTTALLALPTYLEPGFHPLVLVLGLLASSLSVFIGTTLSDTAERNLPQSILAGSIVGTGLWATFYCILESMLIIPALEYSPAFSVGALIVTSLICSAAFIMLPRTDGPEKTLLVSGILMSAAVLVMFAWGLPSVTIPQGSRSLAYIHKFDSQTMGVLVAIAVSVGGIILYSTCVFTRWITGDRTSARQEHDTASDINTAHADLDNRAPFESRLERAMTRTRRSGRQMAVLLLKIDGANLSDPMGKSSQNPILPGTLGASLALCLRTRDALSEFGENRFAIIAEDLVDAAEAGSLAGRMLDCLNDATTTDTSETNITGSIGIAVCPDDGSTVKELMSRAETAMLSIVETGKSGYAFFAPEMNAGNPDMLSLPHLLRLAVRHRQFRLLLQPQYRSDDNSIIGAEALLRWNHPSRGMLAPVHFIGLAEQLGIMPEIDSWVAREAYRILKRWQSMGAPFDTLELSVNARPHLFKDETYAAMLGTLLKETNINPSRLLIEIPAVVTENHIQTPEETADALRSLGVGVALEHFGTGWSSLAYLCTMAAREVKVDRALLQNLSPGSNAEKVMQALLSLIQALNMKAVVEGVETLGMVDHLRSLGVNTLQGYALGQPSPPNVFEATVLESARRLKQGRSSEGNAPSKTPR